MKKTLLLLALCACARAQLPTISGSDLANTGPAAINAIGAYLNTNKEPTITAGSTGQYWRGDKSWQSLATGTYALFSATSPLVFNSSTGAFSCPTCGTGAVSSVFGRAGVVAAAGGDYTAAQVTNAVDATGSYANPAWITSLAW